MGEFNTYDHVIQLETTQGIHLIEKHWMKEEDFNEVRDYLVGLEPKNIRSNSYK